MKYGSPKLEVEKKVATIKIAFPSYTIDQYRHNNYIMKGESKNVIWRVFNRGLISNLLFHFYGTF